MTVHTLATILPTDVNTTSFICFPFARLNDCDGILNFYNALQNQDIQFNIFLCNTDFIDTSHSVIPDGMIPPVVTLTGTTLYTKHCQDKISSTYTDAVSLRDTTTCGYECIQPILLQVHPQLSIQGIAVQNIPRFSLHKNLFLYTEAMVTFSRSHNLRNWKY